MLLSCSGAQTKETMPNVIPPARRIKALEILEQAIKSLGAPLSERDRAIIADAIEHDLETMSRDGVTARNEP